eukprot:CAMPEP_0116914916 /NCGR_PEP_ID=MMETSP0467-20121206/17614_1 /TAXON_ID=283647 /ORGANISM="Mesodinium pulex, Strain SPMC105" /LENGTH=139 /DNA_ID=CAMNT_0004591473 /DNA_START=444 /DNA_END=863 /DNA_ORIENTATION=+
MKPTKSRARSIERNNQAKDFQKEPEEMVEHKRSSSPSIIRKEFIHSVGTTLNNFADNNLAKLGHNNRSPIINKNVDKTISNKSKFLNKNRSVSPMVRKADMDTNTQNYLNHIESIKNAEPTASFSLDTGTDQGGKTKML